MEMKHTPGPWHILVSDNGTPHIHHEQGMDRTDCDDLSSRVCVMPAEIMTHYNALNNARLIAAAPDLLAALKRLSSKANFDNYDHHAAGCGCCIHEALAAIAKATGSAL